MLNFQRGAFGQVCSQGLRGFERFGPWAFLLWKPGIFGMMESLEGVPGYLFLGKDFFFHPTDVLRCLLGYLGFGPEPFVQPQIFSSTFHRASLQQRHEACGLGLIVCHVPNSGSPRYRGRKHLKRWRDQHLEVCVESRHSTTAAHTRLKNLPGHVYTSWVMGRTARHFFRFASVWCS